MKLTERSLTDVLAAFRSSEPTPGGGSASALVGAVGAALVSMVAGIPKPRAATEEDLERLLASGALCADLSERLLKLVDRDSDAYDLVMAAYRLPKTTEEEKSARAIAIQRALRGAIEAPLDVMRACSSGVEQATVVARFANRNASSDVQVALELLAAGLRGAMLNVEINLAGVKDAAYATTVRDDIHRLLLECETGTAAARARLMEPG